MGYFNIYEIAQIYKSTSPILLYPPENMETFFLPQTQTHNVHITARICIKSVIIAFIWCQNLAIYYTVEKNL